jgi:DNA-binding LytR/AlgR family response regulator
MITAIAIDDEPLALELIDTYCKRLDFLVLEKTFSNTAQALQYVQKAAIDVLFLDINMPAISGIELYKSLAHKPMLIFTTSYSEYALESYELNAIDYLQKPFTFNRFEQAALKASERYNLVQKATVTAQTKFILLKVDYGVVKIIHSDILFIEGLDNYIKIHLQQQAPIVVRLTMKSLLEKLNSSEFVRVHRSYIVPINKIESIKQKLITIAGEEIPVGKNYEEGLKQMFHYDD